MVIAQYTIRSKQKYIFKTNKIKDIMGASDIISHVWDILFEVADKADLKLKKAEDEECFSLDSIKGSFDDGGFAGVELFRGGGNETFLFKDEESYKRLNRYFSYRVIKEYPGLVPMAVCTEVSGDYRKDYAALMKEAEKKRGEAELELIEARCRAQLLK